MAIQDYIIGNKMLECSSAQGFGKAAYWLALNYQSDEKYEKAVINYQIAIQNGNRESAFKLSNSFSGVMPSNKLDYLSLTKDPERARRYKLIYDEIDSNPSARFPDIDKIVPLPPAELPEWDGTFEYKKEPQQ